MTYPTSYYLYETWINGTFVYMYMYERRFPSTHSVQHQIQFGRLGVIVHEVAC